MHIKKINEMNQIPEILYRYDYNSNGNDITDPVEVITYEMSELGNVDIPDYCVFSYGNKMRPEVREEIKNSVELIRNGDIDEDAAKHIAGLIISEMERIWHIKIEYVRWLADYDTVVDLYCDEGEEDKIESYETSKYILSDLGGDGILFAYPN